MGRSRLPAIAAFVCAAFYVLHFINRGWLPHDDGMLAQAGQRVLSGELKELEMNGFVRRKVYAEATPVVVEYELTEYSDTLEQVVTALSEWGARHRAHVRQVPATGS